MVQLGAHTLNKDEAKLCAKCLTQWTIVRLLKIK